MSFKIMYVNSETKGVCVERSRMLPGNETNNSLIGHWNSESTQSILFALKVNLFLALQDVKASNDKADYLCRV